MPAPLPVAKAEVLRLHAEGLTLTAAAAVLGVTPQQLRKWTFHHTTVRFGLPLDERPKSKVQVLTPADIEGRAALLHEALRSPGAMYRLARLLEGAAPECNEREEVAAR